jgi:hypothetical protein
MPARGGGLAATALALLGAAGACGGNSFTTADAGTSFDGTTGEATTQPPDAGGTDASPSSDGGHGAEGGPAPDGPSDATAGWCGAHPGHTFCEDFDEYKNVSALFGAWSSFEQTNGNFKLDPSGPPSPPNALEVIGANGAKAVVLKTLSVTKRPTKLRLEFDLRLNSTGSVGLLSAVGLAAIAFGSTVSDGFAALSIGNGPSLSAWWVDSADAGASDAGTFKGSNASGAFPGTGAWAARYAIEVDYLATTGCVQIYEGPTALLSPCLPLPPNLLHPGVVSVVLGDYAAGFGVTGSIDVDFDDVTFDVQ